MKPAMNTNRFSVRLAGLIASLIFIMAFTACAPRSENEPIDTVPASTAKALVRLDRMMDRADVIAREKSHRLDSLKRSYAAATTPRERYRELEALFSEYRSYSTGYPTTCIARVREDRPADRQRLTALQRR